MQMPRPPVLRGRGHGRAGPGIRASSVVAATFLLLLVAACDGNASVVTPPPHQPSTLIATGAPRSPATIDPPTDKPAVTPSATISTGPGAVIARRSSLRLAAPRSRAVAVALGSQILIAGGLTAAGTTDSIEAVAPSSGRSRPWGRLPDAVHDAGGAWIGDVAYVFGGGRFGPTAAVQRFDSSGRAVIVGRLPAIRADLVAVAVGSQIVIVGGGTPSQPDDRVLATTDGRLFRLVARLRVAVRYPAVVSVGHLVYVIGGATPTGDTRLIQAIDVVSGHVAIVGRLVSGLSHASAFAIGDAVLLAGGRSHGRAQNGLWRFDSGNRTFVRVGSLPYAVSDAAAVAFADAEYLIGGEGRGLVASIIAVTRA